MYFILYLIIGVAWACVLLKWNGEKEIDAWEIFLLVCNILLWGVIVPFLAVVLPLIWLCIKLNKLINK